MTLTSKSVSFNGLEIATQHDDENDLTFNYVWNNQAEEVEKPKPPQKNTTINMKQSLILARKIFENRLDIDYVPSCEISINQDQKSSEWLEIPTNDNKNNCCE